jgi:hypothetical protein
MDSNINAYKVLKYMKVLVPVVAVGIVLTIVTFAITITNLVKINREFDETQISDTTTAISSTITTTTTTNPTTTGQPLPNDILDIYIRINDVMNHLQEFQKTATVGNGTRAINTVGFNGTLDYIIDTLRNHTNYNVTTSFSPVRLFSLLRNPILTSSINGTIRNYTY